MAGEVEAGRFVFVDERGTNTSLSPLYAWSRRGERAFGFAPRNRGANVTLLASMTSSGTGPCVAVEGPTTGAVFEAYMERALVPVLRPGQVVVMDNLSRPTRAAGCASWSRRGAARSCTCRRTRRTSKPHRASLRQAQGLTAQSGSQDFRRTDRSDGACFGRDHRAGRLGLLTPLRLPGLGPTTMTNALGPGDEAMQRDRGPPRPRLSKRLDDSERRIKNA